MGSKTISLDDDAYRKLKAAKRPGESFSDVVHRILEPDRPSLLDFTRVLKEGGPAVAEAIERMRAQEATLERKRLDELEG